MDFSGLRLATVVQDAESIYDRPLQGALAWLVGNEGQGVDPHLAALCDRRVTIPMANETESLNAAVAASICMAESARQHVANTQGGQKK
jgi:TrmH family RNA methyltransferase